MSPVSTTSGAKAAPPVELPQNRARPELPEPAERQEPELTGRPSEPLLPGGKNRTRQLIILAAVVVVLVALVIIFR